MRRTGILVVMSLVTLVFGCQPDAGVADGFETGACIAGTCYAHFQCLSGVCVDPQVTGGAMTSVTSDPSTGMDEGSSTGGTPTTTGTVTDSSSTTESTTSTTEGSTTSTSSATNETSPPDMGGSGGPTCGGPGVGLGGACNPFTQNCQDCYKCNPWASGSDPTWNADKCVEIDPNPKEVGEPCSVVGTGISGIDDCVKGAMCWNVDGRTQMGTCVELCSGTLASPVCDTPDTSCVVSNNDSLPLCLHGCDPLNPSCRPGDGCYPSPSSDRFVCVFDASDSGGAYLQSCGYINGCDPGLLCIDAMVLPGCPTFACCTPYCDINELDTCPGMLSCVSFWQRGMAPADLAHVGVCVSG